MKTVTTRLFGGLGNQMFQYALGRTIAERHNCNLVLDSRETDTKDPHSKYALSHFNIRATLGDNSNLPPERRTGLPYYLWRYFGKHPELVRESHLGFNQNIPQCGSDIYLHGYFQTEKYFAGIAKQLRQDLTIKTPPSAENKRWIEAIKSSNSVSLHVRRGDYITAKGGAHAVCDQAYYKRAINHIAAHCPKPEIFVFSDDPDWAQQNLDLGYKTRFSAHNDFTKHYEDMRLISHCKHNITANSTFSWWGSWLNDNPDKIVVAPKIWFGKTSMKNPDIIPDSWVRV
ncbi:MAG: alpha-1,2-fucosyltransferase [Rhodobacterales bacterium]